MAHARKKTWTKTLPTGKKVRYRSTKYYAFYRHGAGRRGQKAGYTDKKATLELARRLEVEAARKAEGLIDVSLEHRKKPIGEHIEQYRLSLQGRVSAKHLAETMRRLGGIIDGCGFRTLQEVNTDGVSGYLHRLRVDGCGPRTCNTYRASLQAFMRWCVETRRIERNPVGCVKPQQEADDIRRERGTFTPDQVVALISASKRRPLEEAMTIRRGKRKGQQCAKLSEPERERLERLGLERALIYKTLALTGLRRGELSRLRWGDLVFFSNKQAMATVRRESAKARKPQQVTLRADLAEDLREWWTLNGEPGNAQRVFRVPGELVKILKRDLKAAGIPYKDELGRFRDVHSLRHTFGTWLGETDVPARVAQEAMRHGSIELTANRYMHPSQGLTRKAVESLPMLPSPHTGEHALQYAPEHAPQYAGTGSGGCQSVSADCTEPAEDAPVNSLQNKDFGREKAAHVGACQKAGDRIRTDDVQLGKRPGTAFRLAAKLMLSAA